ncbi:4-alpha-glucanotransferase [Oscillatoria salina]|uniref:4-alpha-glucanotransferase n=1 Tax=Oscillatoria salina TaxID=331517 RepID=UPI001CCED0B7|nr:4-alpha-glucanotransferase [Oscillatoria salina]MBZ8181237.1 4-alpha-glucanotransferase [Oscillatoria salina IIICB1]
MDLSRASGILLHPTSLPGRFGIGELGPEAYRFIDFLAESYQQVWQILPLGPTGFGNSPYLSYSALAGNPLLIDLEWLHSEGLLAEEDFGLLPEFGCDRVNYDLVYETKLPLLNQASLNFRAKASPSQREAFEQFCQVHSYWLDDYALFMAIKEAHDGASWHTWDEEIAKRSTTAIAKWQSRLSEEIFRHKYLQFEFYRQWSELKNYANEKGIKIFGDIPIYVAHDSADVWAHPDIFCLDKETGEPALMAGVPPDYFSETGQLWGNPVYNWEQIQKNNFKWWIQRFKATLEYVDIIRIDHFRGFESFWAVPQGEKVAINGEWIEAPGIAFFEILREQLGKLPIVAEDLGEITPEVEALRDRFDFPGMKVLHFAFDSGVDNPFLPFNYTSRNCVIYTGTHDNNTTLGWFNERSPEAQQRVLQYLGCVEPEGINWSLTRLALGSIANLAIFPLQDILGLGTEGKMNTPGKEEGNWSWRYQASALTPELCQRLKDLTYLYRRAPQQITP